MNVLKNLPLSSICAATVLVLAVAGESLAQAMSAGGNDPVFVCSELLGRPTDRSIALNLCVDRDAELFVEYGNQPSRYDHQTLIQSLRASTPATLLIDSLSSNTRYYYRVRYRSIGSQEFLAREEHAWHTARPRGRPFAFAVEADPHMDTSTNSGLYERTLRNILSSGPDFLIDLGDTFMSDKLPDMSPQYILSRHLLLRSLFDTLGHSVPLMLVLGNHEGEAGWYLDGTPDNVAIWAANTRMSLYPNPLPEGFYNGNTTPEQYVGLRQNYYAWEWGDALFVVLDPYWYTMRKPGTTKNNWDWTLGPTQYDWFKATLERSSAQFKFVFSHQIVGGNDLEGRGGIEAVPYYEMGGLNADGTPGFASHRPGWPAPLHQLMVENHVTAFFHGHDHVFVKQELDGIVYQELPQPGYFDFSNPEMSYANTKLAAKYGYTHGTILSSSGFLRVTVMDTVSTVDYVRSYLPEHENSQRHNGEVAYSYVLRPSAVTGGVRQPASIPGSCSLGQNYPNPFNPTTRIRYVVGRVVVPRGALLSGVEGPASSKIRLAVYDLLGREVAVLVNERKVPGTYEVSFDASGLASGVYVYRLTAGLPTGQVRSFVQSRTMVLLR